MRVVFFSAAPIAPTDAHLKARKAVRAARVIEEEKSMAALTVQRAVRQRQASKLARAK